MCLVQLSFQAKVSINWRHWPWRHIICAAISQHCRLLTKLKCSLTWDHLWTSQSEVESFGEDFLSVIQACFCSRSPPLCHLCACLGTALTFLRHSIRTFHPRFLDNCGRTDSKHHCHVPVTDVQTSKLTNKITNEYELDDRTVEKRISVVSFRSDFAVTDLAVHGTVCSVVTNCSKFYMSVWKKWKVKNRWRWTLHFQSQKVHSPNL